jgi:glycosyltransferase involved in cell wall biosynthesis
MRILLDAHHIGSGQTGNETYVRELLHALRGFPQLELVAAVDGSPRDAALDPPVRMRQVPHNGWLRLVALSLVGRAEAVDLVHSIYYRVPFAGRPTVVSIHDVSYERFPEFFSRRERRKNQLLVRSAARDATMVVTLSEHARSEMIELYGLDAERVAVVPGGVARIFLADPGPPPSRPPDDRLRILAVGTLQPRKNLLRLLDAVALVAEHRPVLLRVVGPGGHQAGGIRARLGTRADVELVGYVTEEELASEYRAADVFAYPSIYEGFGLPVIEAMACGTPVMTSTGGSLPEVAGDAALIVEPYDVPGMAQAIERLADDAALRETLRSSGRLRAAAFSWEAAAAKLVDVYERVAGG